MFSLTDFSNRLLIRILFVSISLTLVQCNTFNFTLSKHKLINWLLMYTWFGQLCRGLKISSQPWVSCRPSA